MSATIRMPQGIEATLNDDGAWLCDDDLLRVELQDLFPLESEGGQDPDPTHSTARRAAEYFEAEVIAFDDPEAEDGVVY